jgi:hydroxyacylglutathione hydrolase
VLGTRVQCFLLSTFLANIALTIYHRFFTSISAHEYTASNAKFAVSVEPGNEELMKRFQEITEKRSRGEYTVPTQMGLEKRTNPFLRVDISDEIRTKVGVTAGDSGADAFAKVRLAKDNFRG